MLQSTKHSAETNKLIGDRQVAILQTEDEDVAVDEVNDADANISESISTVENQEADEDVDMENKGGQGEEDV